VTHDKFLLPTEHISRDSQSSVNELNKISFSDCTSFPIVPHKKSVFHRILKASQCHQNANLFYGVPIFFSKTSNYFL